MSEIFYKKDNNLGYYLIDKDLGADFYLSGLINLSTKEFKNILINRYNGYNTPVGIFFKNKKDILLAIEWFNNILLLKKLGD